MLKENLKDFIVISSLVVVLVFGVVHFNDICSTITTLFKL